MVYGAGVSERKAAVVIPVVALLGGLAVATHAGATVLIALCAAVAAACITVPAEWLPPIALVAALVLPYEVTRWPVALFPMVVWLIRATPVRIESRTVRWGALCLGVWLVLAATFASVQSRSGVIWLAVALCAVVWPMVRGAQLANFRELQRVFVGLTSCLAGFALIEKFVLKSNPVYGSLYAVGGDPIIQGHTYRATTLLGHPLVNGAIFATAAVLAIDEALMRSARRGSLLRVLLLLSGLGATVSRGSTAAAIVGIGLLVLTRRGRTSSTLRKALVSLAVLLAGIVFIGDLAARNSSTEGQRSTMVRAMLISDTERALSGHSVLGVGPGEVEKYRQQFGLLHFDPRSQTTPPIALESTYAEVLVGIGIPGVCLFLLVIAGAVIHGLRSEMAVASACALLTYSLALGTFKTEGHVQLLIVLGLLLSLAMVPNKKAASNGGPLEPCDTKHQPLRLSPDPRAMVFDKQ
jgi:hypothetical protein